MAIEYADTVGFEPTGPYTGHVYQCATVTCCFVVPFNPQGRRPEALIYERPTRLK